MKTKKAFAATEMVEKMPKEAERQDRTLAIGIHPNVLIFEEQFVRRYHQVETLLKEREIKFFKCIGDPALTEEQRKAISDTREENAAYMVEFSKNKDLRRYEVDGSGERIVVPVDVQLKTDCKWNVLSNDLFSLRQRNLSNLVKMSATIMTRIRVSVRLARLKAQFDQVFWESARADVGKCENEGGCGETGARGLEGVEEGDSGGRGQGLEV